MSKSVQSAIQANGAVKIAEIEFEIGGSPCYHVDLALRGGGYGENGDDIIISKYFFLVKREDGFCDKTPVIRIFDDYYNKN